MYRPQPQQGRAGCQQLPAGDLTPQDTSRTSLIEQMAQDRPPELSWLTPQQHTPPVQARERAASHQPAQSVAQSVPYGQASYSPPDQSYAQQQPSQVPPQFNMPELPTDHDRESLDKLVEGCRGNVNFLDEYEPKICHRPTPVWDTDDSRKLLYRLLGDCHQAAATLDAIETANSYTPMPSQYHLSYQTEPGSSTSNSVSYCRSAIKRYKVFLEKRRAPDDNGKFDELEDASFSRGGEADTESVIHSETTGSPPPNSLRPIPGLISYDGMELYNDSSPEDRAVHNQNIQTETLDLRQEIATLRRHYMSHDLGVPPATLYDQAQLHSGIPSQSAIELYTSISRRCRAIHNRWIAAEVRELRSENEALRGMLEERNIYVGRTDDEESHPLRQYAIRVQRGRLCDDQMLGILDWN